MELQPITLVIPLAGLAAIAVIVAVVVLRNPEPMEAPAMEPEHEAVAGKPAYSEAG